MNISEQGQTMETRSISPAMIDAAGSGVFFIWIGTAFLLNVGWGLGIGIVALGVQLMRRLLAMKVDRWGFAFGICLTVAGVAQLVDRCEHGLVTVGKTLLWPGAMGGGNGNGQRGADDRVQLSAASGTATRGPLLICSWEPLARISWEQ
jgi:hypothetical protein